MVYFAHHDPGFRGMGGGILKILADTVFQLLGLAHVDDLIRLVPHDVNTRGIGQGQRLFLQFIKCHGFAPKKDRPMQPTALRRSIEDAPRSAEHPM